MKLLITQTLFLLLPVYLANAGGTLSIKFKFLDFLKRPIDLNKKIGSNYILGPGKTYRGAIVILLLGLIAALIQKYLYAYPVIKNISIINYQEINILIFGLICGFGALLGDTVASFLKRRLGLPRGKFFPLVDQLDFITGFFLLLPLIIKINWQIVLTAYILTLIIHPLTNIIAYFLKLKNVYW